MPSNISGPARFAVTVGSSVKWVNNLSAVLGRRFRYDIADARRIGLAREVNSFGLPLERADQLAGRVLARDSDASGGDTVAVTPSGAASIHVDVGRYLSTFTARLALAVGIVEGRKRGRPARTVRDPIAAARMKGIDVGLLVSSLGLTPAERLERLDRNAAFVASMRRVLKE